jgi:hypothetical protein
MNGLDPIIASTLATRIDSVLGAVAGGVGSTQSPTTAPQTVTTPVPAPGAGAGQANQAANPSNASAPTTLSNTALTLATILQLDTKLLASLGPQTQQGPLLSTPPSEADEQLLQSGQAQTQASTSTQTSAQPQGADASASTQNAAAAAVAQEAAEAALLDEPASTLEAAAAGGATAAADGTAAENAAQADSAQTSATAGTAASANLAALSANADPLSAALGNALQQALGNSGMFYESHLAQWLTGERSSSSLQSEPQAQLNNPGNAAQAGANPSAASALADKLSNTLTNFLNAGSGNTAETQGATNANDAAALASSARSTVAQAGLPLNPDSVGLVRQQLDVLATSQFQWSGEAWPGAQMRWEVERRDDDGSGKSGGKGQDADDSKQVWHSRITLDLPHLGKVDAVLSLSGKQLMARVTANAESASTLSNASNDFRRHAMAAGLSLSSLQIRSSDDAAAAEPEAAAAPASSPAAVTPAPAPSPETAALLRAYARGGRR